MSKTAGVVIVQILNLVANSTPIVALLSRLNSFREYRDNKLLFPTPESPMSTTV